MANILKGATGKGGTTGATSRRSDTADRACVEALLRYWSAQDVEQTLSCFTDDIVYQLHICRSAHPFGGEMVGIDAVRTMLFDILAHFDTLQYEPVVLGVSDGVARIQTSYVLHHRASGTDLVGTKRFVCILAGGLITRVYEYHDMARVEAFMAYASSRPLQQATGL
jgi:ketosteroid isomerase-like protein